ncbi:MAG: hypothetical protein ACYCW6_15325 [Candidatus Xenobia bacterium]
MLKPWEQRAGDHHVGALVRQEYRNLLQQATEARRVAQEYFALLGTGHHRLDSRRHVMISMPPITVELAFAQEGTRTIVFSNEDPWSVQLKMHEPEAPESIRYLLCGRYELYSGMHGQTSQQLAYRVHEDGTLSRSWRTETVVARPDGSAQVFHRGMLVEDYDPV